MLSAFPSTRSTGRPCSSVGGGGSRSAAGAGQQRARRRRAATPDAATEREARYTVVTSEPYLLVADGGPIFLSGIEGVGNAESSPVTLSLAKGRYSVRASIVAWDEEPGGRGPDGLPTPNALPDFLVVIALSDGSEAFRTTEITFDPLR